VDLLGAIRAARDLRDAVAPQVMQHAWEHDEEAFLIHFGVPFEAYQEIVEHLDERQCALLDATLRVNPEAAVLWVLAMEQIG
jgi:hypothetical protein